MERFSQYPNFSSCVSFSTKTKQHLFIRSINWQKKGTIPNPDSSNNVCCYLIIVIKSPSSPLNASSMYDKMFVYFVGDELVLKLKSCYHLSKILNCEILTLHGMRNYFGIPNETENKINKNKICKC